MIRYHDLLYYLPTWIPHGVYTHFLAFLFFFSSLLHNVLLFGIILLHFLFGSNGSCSDYTKSENGRGCIGFGEFTDILFYLASILFFVFLLFLGDTTYYCLAVTAILFLFAVFS